MNKISEEYLKTLEKQLKEKNYISENLAFDKTEESIEFLYDSAEKYATENYIYPTKDEFGRHYTVSYNQNNYNIGYIVGQGAFFYFKKTDEEAMFDLKDIIMEKKANPKADEIKQKIEKLKQLVAEIKEEVPEYHINEEIHKVYKK